MLLELVYGRSGEPKSEFRAGRPRPDRMGLESGVLGSGSEV